MHLDELADHCQSDTQSALRAIQRSRRLSEEFKHVRERIGDYTDSSVSYAQHYPIAFLLQAQPNVAAFGSVFHSVVEEVYDHFLKAL